MNHRRLIKKAAFSTTSFMSLALVSLAPVAAQATPEAGLHSGERWPRWYVGISGGVQFLSDADIRAAGIPGDAEFDTGGIFTGSLGYRPRFGNEFLDGFRVEAELGYHFAGLDRSTGGGVAVPLRGTATAWSYMGNLYYDIRNSSRFTPYVGAGAGGAHVKIPQNAALGTADESEDAFAYQFMAGVAYAPVSIPLTEWSLGYRYFAVSDLEFGSGATRLDVDGLDAHSVELGAKFRF